MKFSVREIAKSASRALGVLYAKFLHAGGGGGMSINVYTKLVETIVEPVLFFCSGIWGLTKFSEKKTVLNKACRYFLGVTKHCSNVSLRGDLGWSSCEVNKKLNLFVCGVGYIIYQSTGLYDGSTIGLSLKVDHGRKRC